MEIGTPELKVIAVTQTKENDGTRGGDKKITGFIWLM